MRPESEIRISRIQSFTECARYAIGSLATPWDGRLHIATWVGSTVHARLSGWEVEPRPADIEYDRVTSTGARADEAVEKILSAVAEFDRRHRPVYIEREMPVATVCGSTRLVGTVDALCLIDGRVVAVALKTGRQPYTVWVQSALHAWIADRYYEADGYLLDRSLIGAPEEEAPAGPKRKAVPERGEEPGLRVDAIGCLHVPRVGPRTEQRWSYEERDYERFAHDVAQWGYTLDMYAQAGWHQLAAHPGMHCARCPVEDCAVRGAPRKERRAASAVGAERAE